MSAKGGLFSFDGELLCEAKIKTSKDDGVECTVSSLVRFAKSLCESAGVDFSKVLAVGMGVDANIITGERIKEEVNSGKSLEVAIRVAYKRAFSAILDGNITNVLIAIILMGAFGVPTSFFSKILNSTVFFMFGATTEGVVYSFGFTLLVGVVCNFIFGVFASRLMVTSLSRFKGLQNRKLYGGDAK